MLRDRHMKKILEASGVTCRVSWQTSLIVLGA